MSARVRVKRDGLPERPWRAMVRTEAADTLAGYFATHDEAVTAGITAARFLEAGVVWRAVGLPDLEVAP